jgi:serine/threonine-protein kinase
MKTHLGHYEIVSELGRGGMGVVYKGYEPALSRYVAIKELSPMLAHDPAVVERFLREARSMAMLNDPHIIQIYSIGQEEGLPFFVMEFVEGSSVAALILRDLHLYPEDALKIVHQTARGLVAAHERGVIHRDIKPANLIVSQRGQVKIADFGIALANADAHQKLTSAGEMVGTPGYLSPELLLGRPVDQRSDVYALGVVLFEMLTGRTPFSDASVYKLMMDVVQTEVPDVREINSEIDPGVAAILAKMLIKDPAKRYQTMQELVADLEKHPLVARGGQLRLNVRATDASTSPRLVVPSEIRAARGATPPPVMDRRDPLTGVSSPGRVMTPPPAAASDPRNAVSAPTLARDMESAGVDTPPPPPLAPEPQPAARPKRRYGPIVLFVAAVVASGLGWWQRVPISEWLDANAPNRAQWLGWWSSFESWGAAEIDPLLRRIGLRVPPELVIDALALLVVLLLVRNLYASVVRSRNRRAYARAQARNSA